MTAYTLGDAARICGVSPRRLRYWERTALVSTSPRDDDAQTSFDFRALVSVRRIVGLLERGVPLQRIRSSVAAVRERIPDLEPLPALHAWGAGGRVVVRHEGVLMEPDGQLVLELAVDEQSRRLVALRSGDSAREIALGWFERGCELDTDRETYGEALAAYTRAVEIDPAFADAHCNLGSVYFNLDRRDRARECFARAVEIEPGHVEANLNLGTLCEEEGADEAALRHYRAALETDPLFPDTHVSLALLYEKVALPRTARSHWRRYLTLDPAGTFADLARQRLESH